MPITTRAYGPNASGTDVSLTGNPPAAGERLVCWGVTDNAASSMTGPGTGWTARPSTTTIQNTADSQSMLAWTLDALTAGTETIISIVTGSTSLNGALAIGGDVDPTVFLDVAAVSANDNAADPTGDTLQASLTTVTPGCLVLAIVGLDVTANVDATASFGASGAAGAVTAAGILTDQRDGFRNVVTWGALQTNAGAITVTATSSLPSGNAGMSMILMAVRTTLGGGSPASILRQMMAHHGA